MILPPDRSSLCCAIAPPSLPRPLACRLAGRWALRLGRSQVNLSLGIRGTFAQDRGCLALATSASTRPAMCPRVPTALLPTALLPTALVSTALVPTALVPTLVPALVPALVGAVAGRCDGRATR